MRRILLLPLTLAFAATLVPAAVSAIPAAAAASPAASRDITAIARAEGAAHAPNLRKPLATVSAPATPYTYLRDVYPVGKTAGITVDYARGVPARYPNPPSKSRWLPISIWYPAASGPIASTDTFWARARPGQFPLVVFAPGFNANPESYQRFLHALAAQGYIVAAPVFPLEASIPGAAPATRSNTEMLNQMYDMSTVISQMITYSKTPGNFLSTAMNPSLVAVVGHSDGAMTVAGMTMSTSYTDKRVKTAVVMSGAGPDGLTWKDRKVVPTMVEQATKDPYNAPSNSQWLFNTVRGARSYLTVNGVYHIWPLIGTDKVADLTRRAVVAHLNGQLKGGGAGSFWQLVAAGNAKGLTSLRFAS